MLDDSVKFIIKVVLKVPCIIFASYLLFNLFAFGLTYFKLLGLSYVVLQTGVENNYLPETEATALQKYIDDLDDKLGLVDNISFTDDTKKYLYKPEGSLGRQQYGKTITLGVQGDYRFLYPLMPHEQKSNNVAVDGVDGTGAGDSLSTGQLAAKRDKGTFTIKIEYKVPGLKYYSDLDDK